MPADSSFSQETALLGNCERKSFFVAVDDADREQDQGEAVIHDQILEPNVVRNGDGFLRPSAADLFCRTGFKMALYEKIFFMFGVREQDQDRGVRKMEIMEGLDQFFLFDDGGMRDGLEELPVEEKPQRPKAAFPEGLKALCLHSKTVIHFLFPILMPGLKTRCFRKRFFQMSMPRGPCRQKDTIFSFAIRITAIAVPVNNNKLIRHYFFAVEVYEE
jgi:hypothetical protein